MAQQTQQADKLREIYLNAYNQYTYGSAAPVLEPEIVRPESPKAPKQNRKPAQVPEKQGAIFRGFLLLVSAAALLLLAFTAVNSAVANYNTKNRIAALKRELAEAQSYTVIASELPEDSGSLSAVYTYATKDLGMTNASKSEVLTIVISRGAYTSDYTTTEADTKTIRFHWFGN